MKNNIYYSPKAFNDLEEIRNFIIFETDNLEQADRLVIHIMNTIDCLENFSKIGKLLSNVIDIECEYRFLVCDNYKIFYWTNDNNIYIDRILHTKRDYLRILFLE